MNYLLAFLFGGAVCVLGQVVLDKSKLSQADLMVILVVLGSFLSAIGLYEPLIDTFGAGATVLVANFGHILTKGVVQGFKQAGILGLFAGGIQTASAVLAAAIIFGFLGGVLFRPKG